MDDSNVEDPLAEFSGVLGKTLQYVEDYESSEPVKQSKDADNSVPGRAEEGEQGSKQLDSSYVPPGIAAPGHSAGDHPADIDINLLDDPVLPTPSGRPRCKQPRLSFLPYMANTYMAINQQPLQALLTSFHPHVPGTSMPHQALPAAVMHHSQVHLCQAQVPAPAVPVRMEQLRPASMLRSVNPRKWRLSAGWSWLHQCSRARIAPDHTLFP
jgi:hypothetical protein